MKKNIITSAILFFLTLISFILSLYLIQNFNKKVPDITQVNYDYKSEISPLTIKDALKISKGIKEMVIENPSLSFCGEAKNTDIKGFEIKPVLTNRLYFKNHNLKVKNFNSDSIVISKQFALKLFFNYDVIGKKVSLYNKQYSIVGLYDNKDNIINANMNDNVERVYLHYKALNNYHNVKVTEFSYDNNSMTAVAMEQMNLMNYCFTNFSDKLKVIDNFRQIIILIVFITALVVGIKVWFIICKNQLTKIKETLQCCYILQSIRKSFKNYILLFVVGIGIPCGFIGLFLLCNFNIFIIANYMPYDNIFDIGYYLSAYTETLQQFNSTALAGNCCLINLYSFTFNTLLFLTIIFAIVFITTVCCVINLIKAYKCEK